MENQLHGTENEISEILETDSGTDQCDERYTDSVSVVETEDSCQSVRRRVAFTEHDLAIIREQCGDIIWSTEPINAKELKRRFRADARLAKLEKSMGFNLLKIKMRTGAK